MTPPLTESSRVESAEQLLERLSTRQFVAPHQLIGDALREALAGAKARQEVIERSIRWLGIDASQKIGRLKRTELNQLARCLHRFRWLRARDGPNAIATGRTG